MSAVSRIPPEIWLQIFGWATAPKTADRYADSYAPFASIPGESSEDTRASLQVKINIIRVCRAWKALAIQILYEDVVVGRGLPALRHTLEITKTGEDEGYGRWVKRLELPYSSTLALDPDTVANALEVVKHCPRLQVLVRPFHSGIMSDLHSDFPIDAISLTYLKRLEWWHFNDAARSGGVNSLDDMLHAAPDLRYVAVGGELYFNFTKQKLPYLTTLRLRKINTIFLHQICQWTMPALLNVIVESPVRALESFWATFGQRLHTVELSRNLGFCFEQHIPKILLYCATLVEFYYYLYFVVPPLTSTVHTSLRCIGLHAFPNAFPLRADFLMGHLTFLASSSFPSLQRIVLYGDWDNIVQTNKFKNWHQAMIYRGYRIETPDGMPLKHDLMYRPDAYRRT